MIDKQLGQYKILAEVGRGGMGIVYKAYQTSLNREVAIKVLPPALSTDKNLVSRFHREAESAARLSHPNIVQIFDINEIDGIHFFAMEYLRGETLTHGIEKKGPLAIKEAIRIAMAVSDALNYSHAEGIVHRDIKPGNIMINPHGHVKVTDFGLARIMESSRLTLTGTIIGTPEYMSPEQARGDTLDGRSDLYSLGIVLYEALTAKLPFHASTPFAVAQKQIYDPLPSPCSIRPEIPATLEGVIIKATQKDPAQRYQRGEDFKNDLEGFITGTGLERITPTIAVAPGAPPRQGQRTFFKRMLWGGIVLGIILLIGFFFLPPQVKEDALQKTKALPELIEEKELEVVPPLATEKPAGDEARNIIKDVRRLIVHGAYRDAIASLEDFMERFPGHPQANLMPQWIKEIQDREADREAGGKFKEAERLADSGEIVQAILEFNQIARDYPGTKWETMSNEKAGELERTLKEGEAKKEFLEAQEFVRQRKFIEATQRYQSITSRFPGTAWAERSQEEISKLKEAQARIHEKFVQPRREPQYREPPQEFKGPSREAEKLIEGIKKSDPAIEKLIRFGDDRKLAGYLWTQHKTDLKKIAMAMDIPGGRIDRPFLDMVARYLMGGDMAPHPPDRRMQEDFRPEEERFSPEDKLFEEFIKKAQSNKTVQKYIKKRDAEGLRLCLMSKYFREIKKISKELDRPFRDVAWELSEKIVHEREAKPRF